jgi:hypothetical protein
MTRIYVDVEAAEIDGGGSTGPSLEPNAPRTLCLLVEAGHEVVLVTGQAGPPPDALSAVASDAVGAPAAQPEDRAWYLTADVERCSGSSARMRTVLVGGQPPAGSVHRCDGVARDLRAAVIDILTSEAMPRSA